MELLNILKETDCYSAIVWNGQNSDLLKKYLKNNGIGRIYKPKGDYFEEIIMDLVVLKLYKNNRIIVNIDDIMKYPLKHSVSANNTTIIKNQIINTTDLENILWILPVHKTQRPVTYHKLFSFLNENESLNIGLSLIWKCAWLLKFEERTFDNGIDISLIQPTIKEMKWTLNKDLEEVK